MPGVEPHYDVAKREAQATIFNLQNFVEKCEKNDESVFYAIFKLENIIEKSNDKKNNSENLYLIIFQNHKKLFVFCIIYIIIVENV